MNPSIAILLAAYNGEEFLKEQLDSIENQTLENWHLYVLDDGSKDKTYEIFESYQKKWGFNKITLFKMENQGCARAFLSLVSNSAIKADYYAYCDQDDIWNSNKLETAIRVLTVQDQNIPLLYCSSAYLIDEKGDDIGRLPIKTKPMTFSHALVQALSVGNTMVFNEVSRKIIAGAGVIAFTVNHDWWTGLAVSGAGGFVFYDSEPSLLYRQHGKNVMGFSSGYFQRYKKALKRVLNDDFKQLNREHIEALHKIYDYLTPDSKQILSFYEKSLSGNVFKRLYFLYKSGVYRQDFFGTLSVYIAQAMRKL